MTRIVVIHENEEWFPPLREALEHYHLDYGEMFMGEGAFADMSVPPEPALFYNRMSASSWTRAHGAAPQITLAFLENAQARGSRVVNSARALDLEISKARQAAVLQRFGVRVPRSVLTAGREGVAAAAATFEGPVILKPDCGGKGAGVALFETPDALIAHARSEGFAYGPDVPLLVQAYVRPAEPYIIRNEFVGGRHLYSVRVDTSQGFELCPADQCEIGDAACPAGSAAGAPAKFEVLTDFTHPDIPVFERLLADQGIAIAGIEFLFDAQGRAWTYDININTNYNGQAEAEAGIAGSERAGMRAVAAYLGRESGQLPVIPAAAE
ncbi:MAG: alpha-L-glutamate ligase [Alphaproteobacteria bacterium]|nr:MAG: alpha-L-glutamate ligase [Alphaproteobacteria bacterium]